MQALLLQITVYSLSRNQDCNVPSLLSFVFVLYTGMQVVVEPSMYIYE